MVDETREATEKRFQAYAALGVAFVCIGIGVPLWWKTTEVYRVSLPYSDISELSTQRMTYAVHIHVISLDKNLKSPQLASLKESLEHAFERGSTVVDGLSPEYHCTARLAYEDELLVYEKVKTVQELDDKLNSAKVLIEHGRYYVYVLPERTTLEISNGFISKRQSVYFKTEDLSVLLSKIVRLVKNVFVREDTVARAYKNERGVVHLKPDKDSMRVTKSSPNYDITFTLLNPQPDIVDARWDVAQAVDAYLNPFLNKLSDYVGFKIKSQVLHYTHGFILRPRFDEEKKEFFLLQDDLPGVINPIERELGSYVSNDPGINFVVYVPTRTQTPLFMRDEDGKNVSTNAFLSPRWGGFIIYNMADPPKETQLPALVQMDMKNIMETCISQMRLLLGIDTEFSGGNLTFEELGASSVAEWELDFWLRKRAIENTAIATSTLASLAQLLGKINNIVINDDIGNEVQHAVKSIENSYAFLKENKIRDGFLTSRQAIISSEKAFFDESLLELLYFPDDQKFAIYIPLFLPISLPVLLTSYHALKWLRDERKKAKVD